MEIYPTQSGRCRGVPDRQQRRTPARIRRVALSHGIQVLRRLWRHHEWSPRTCYRTSKRPTLMRARVRMPDIDTAPLVPGHLPDRHHRPRRAEPVAHGARAHATP